MCVCEGECVCVCFVMYVSVSSLLGEGRNENGINKLPQ